MTTQTPKLSWSALFHNGSVVSLSISLWRARAKILASDLGIEDTAEVKAALSLGCHRLAPSKAFDDILAIAREAQKVIDQLSMNFGLIKGARFIPEKNIALLTERLSELKGQFYVAVEAFRDGYDPMRQQQLPILKLALVEAAGSLEVANRAYDRLVAEYPSAAEVITKFSFAYSLYTVTSAKSAEAQKFAQQETDEVKSIVADMVKQLRDETSETLKSVISLATKGGKLNKRTIESAQATIERIKGLNILGDTVLGDQLAAVEKALGLVDRSEVTTGFVTGLSQIQSTLETSLADAIAEAEQALTGVGHRAIEVEEEGPAQAGPYLNGHAEANAFEGL